MEKKTIKESKGKSLPLVEEFFTIQGEGYHTGKAAYFIRLGGCDIGCSWCDSRYSWNMELHPLVNTDIIINKVLDSGADSVVVTGGEPLLWDLDYLCSELKKKNINTYLETSGAHRLSGEWNWICLSPKMNMPPVNDICSIAHELKVIIQDKSDFEWAEIYKRKVNSKCRLFLQPEWSKFETIIPEIVRYIKSNPVWRISLQVHKYMHIP
jgi:7-carboxy-7-deazaguanine synthase